MNRYLGYALSFKGVLNRIEFVIHLIVSPFVIAVGVLMILGLLAKVGIISPATVPIQDIYLAITAGLSTLFILSAVVRRLRDIGASGWWTIAYFVPYLNLGLLFTLVFKSGWNRVMGLDNLFAMMKHLAESDGKVNQDEALFFSRFCSENISNEQLVRISVESYMAGASNPILTFDHHLNQYLKKANLSMNEKAYIMELLVGLAGADGRISQSEDILLQKAYSAFRLAEDLPEGFDDLIGMLNTFVKTKSVIDQTQIETIQNWLVVALGFTETLKNKAIKKLETADTPNTFENYTRNLFLHVQGNTALLKHVIELLTKLLVSKPNPSKEEVEMVNTAAKIFGLDHEECEDDAFAYARVLGVDVNATMEEIKAKYRKLMAANHPDKVATMSEAIRRAAEVETKNINRAYEYFKALYA